MPNYSRNDLTGQAYDLILKKIIDAEYEPGQKISEKRLKKIYKLVALRLERHYYSYGRKVLLM